MSSTANSGIVCAATSTNDDNVDNDNGNNDDIINVFACFSLCCLRAYAQCVNDVCMDINIWVNVRNIGKSIVCY